jgi:hypothetical protein
MYLYNVFKRIFLFQIYFALAYVQFKALGVNANNFKDKAYELAGHFNFKHNIIDDLLKNPELICQILLGVQVFGAAIAILGSRLGGFLAALVIIIDTAVHHNPLAPNQKHDVDLGKFSFSHELVVRIAIISATLAYVFSSCQPCYAGKAATTYVNKPTANTTVGKDKKRN